MPRSRIALVLLSLASLSGCATSSIASRRTRTAEEPEATPPTRQAPSPERKTPAASASTPPAQAPEPAVAPAPTPRLSNAEAEFFCGKNGKLERRVPTERPADVVPFEPRMKRPEKLSGPQPLYTQEALDRNIQGQMLARCLLTREGTVRSCRILKPLPLMDVEVLHSLCASRYTPVLDRGQPVDVEYTFNVRLTPP